MSDLATSRQLGTPPARSDKVPASSSDAATTARGERTRRRVADALRTLLEEGGPPPTAREVAKRAGVSVRLVFHHFEDMDAVYRLVAAMQLERHWRAVRPAPPHLALETRITRTVRQRQRLFEAIAPVRRAGMSIALRRPAVAEVLATSSQLLRSWLEVTFADELARAGRGRRELLAALDTTASFEAWDHLRRVNGLPPVAARRVVERGLRAFLS